MTARFALVEIFASPAAAAFSRELCVKFRLCISEKNCSTFLRGIAIIPYGNNYFVRLRLFVKRSFGEVATVWCSKLLKCVEFHWYFTLRIPHGFKTRCIHTRCARAHTYIHTQTRMRVVNFLMVERAWDLYARLVLWMLVVTEKYRRRNIREERELTEKNYSDTMRVRILFGGTLYSRGDWRITL